MIVVRHVDKVGIKALVPKQLTVQDGNETLSASPFHIRFGKLQLLRAADKRVRMSLPNNDPEEAPFSMKVGETGEAFFVMETSEDVPEDLITSPVVSPTEVRAFDPDSDVRSICRMSPSQSGQPRQSRSRSR